MAEGWLHLSRGLTKGGRGHHRPYHIRAGSVFGLACLSLVLLVAPSSAQTLVVQLDYDRGNVSLANLTVEPRAPPRVYDPKTGYRLELLTPEQKVVYRLNFSFPGTSPVALPPREWFDSSGKQVYTPPPGGGGALPTPSAKANVTLRIPWFGNALTLRILDPQGKQQLTANLTPRLCNTDQICSRGESSLLCPAECVTGSPDRYCDGIADGRCGPDCPLLQDPDCSVLEEETRIISNISRAVEKNESPFQSFPSSQPTAPPASPSPTPNRGFLGLPGFEITAAITALSALLLLFALRQKRSER